MPFKETWNHQIFPILCFLGVKLTIVNSQTTNSQQYSLLRHYVWTIRSLLTCITYGWQHVITQCTHPNSDVYHCVDGVLACSITTSPGIRKRPRYAKQPLFTQLTWIPPCYNSIIFYFFILNKCSWLLCTTNAEIDNTLWDATLGTSMDYLLHGV